MALNLESVPGGGWEKKLSGAGSASCQARLAPLLADPQLDLEVADRGSAERKYHFYSLINTSPHLASFTKRALWPLLLEEGILNGLFQL